MAETDSHEEPALLGKRKANDEREQETHLVKSQKLEAEPDQENQNHANQNHDLKNSNHANHETRLPTDRPNGVETAAIDADDDDCDSEEDDEDEEDEEEEGGPIDRKGKGVMIQEEEEDSDDDSSDGGVESGAESDLSEDPLAEVDLDNILPSRTRRRAVQPGVYIANDVAGNDDDSDSDA